jgi:hypothetical protein
MFAKNSHGLEFVSSEDVHLANKAEGKAEICSGAKKCRGSVKRESQLAFRAALKRQKPITIRQISTIAS